MKKKALLFGSLPALAIAGGVFLSNTDVSEGKYEQRLSSHLKAESNSSAEGAFEYLQMIRGEFTAEDRERALAIANSVGQSRATYNWIDQGPDNIGGRTRAIVVDRNNINHLYAGSVSGGLFESINRSNTWRLVPEFDGNKSISSMCQTIDGTFYAATGHQQERIFGLFDSGAMGYGIYKKDADGSWNLIEGTQNYAFINEIVCDDVSNVVWFACSGGLKKYDPATGDITDADGGFPSGACNSLAISKDGSVIVAHSTATGAKVFSSTDGGASFNEVSTIGEDPGLINMISVGRIEFAISHEKVDGNYRVYGSAASGQLEGIWRSANSGVTWERIAPAYDGAPGGFSPFTSGGSGQGQYNNIITVVPGAPDRILLGGIDCYSWSTTGNWEQISQWFLSPTSPLYVHADNHEFTWDEWGRLYIGNDGGVGVSENANTADPVFRPANRGYNVTQFYAMGVSAHGDVIGGTQDNGTLANFHTGTTYQEHREVGGGDGFSADISFINRNIMFGSVYYSSVYRSSDRGENGSPFFPPEFADGDPCGVGALDGTGCGEFNTTFELWEDPDDEDSQDSLSFIPSESYNMGDVIQVPSAVSQTFIPYTTPIDIIFDDTLDFDPALTIQDTVVIDEITESEFNLGLLDWEFIFGAPTISDGDSIRIFGVESEDTIIVESFTTVDHYFGTNPDKPGLFVDMGNDEQVYNIAWDTLKVIDPYQAWFALDMGGSNGLWMTRNALRFSATSQGWFKAADGLGGIACMEFSKNGDYLFIGTSGGKVWRLTGFNDAYSPTEVREGAGLDPDTLIDYRGEPHLLELTDLGSFGSIVTSISTGPIDDPDQLVITLGTFNTSGRVRRSTNATDPSPTFSVLPFPGDEGEGAAIPGIPCYASIIDRDDPNIIMVGTEFGVFASEDAGSNWEYVSGAFERVAIHDIEQNWRTYDEGCFRPGEIYIGSHGRGIWSTDALLSIPEEGDNLDKNKFIPNLSLFPNPVKDAGTVEFNLAANGDVTLQIFNLNGQVVNQVQANNLEAGKNQIAFDANDLPRGTYILRVSSDTMSETTKFIKH